MLSILIPVYNQDVTKLVSDLVAQCEALDIEYLISVYDDKSTRKYKKLNEKLHHVFKVNYIELSDNLGRAKIRNWLAGAAPHDNLLFMDGDSGVIREDYIKSYLGHIPNYDVVYGGRTYTKKPPRSLKKRLHWKYGQTVEALPAKERRKDPALHFQSNNFLVKASVLEQIKFDEQIVGYGYEDILLGQQIVAKGYKIEHIDNPIEHLGLESTPQYLLKSKKAIDNLIKLQQQDLLKQTRLTKFYSRLSRWRLCWLIPLVYNRFKSKIELQLYAKDPDIRAFQMTKLYWYWQGKNHEL